VSTYAALAHSIWVDGYDMTGDANNVALGIKREALDSTVFGPTVTARSRAAGLEDVQSSGKGLWQAGSGTVDPQVFANLGGLKVVTQTPAGTETQRAYFYQCRDFNYDLFGNVGELAPFSVAMQGTKGSGTLSAGAIAGYLGKAKGTVSATGALGTFKQLGAVGASQYLYGSVHLFGTAGTTITVVLESDDNSSFTSAATRITFGPLTAIGGTWGVRAAGAILDDYYRFRVTACTGTWTIAAAMGIK
jgi:hypothetical protein